jgi:hypothetical protein
MFSMSDTLPEMEFELNRHMANLATHNTVSFMRDSLRIIISGLEIGNAKLGPFLSIDGWAESVTHDMHRYDHALERIYKRYWRRQQMSPLMELAWLILGSMLTWHFKTKFFGPQSSSHRATEPSRTTNASDSSCKPSPPSSPGTSGTTNNNRPASRPTLRAPGASLLGSIFG